MKIIAVICEYNPFHNGHMNQIKAVRDAFRNKAALPDMHEYDDGVCVLSLMSGNFVQRGEPAILPKYERAKAAVSCGSDVVLELPFPYCCSPAENFARGAISILNSLGGIDYLCFGSELAYGQASCEAAVERLSEYAKNLISERFEKSLSMEIKSDKSLPYPVARAKTYKALFGKELPVLPNDILGIEYIKELMLSKSSIKPVSLPRTSDFSATKSRKALLKKNNSEIERFLPPKSLEIFARHFLRGEYPACEANSGLTEGEFLYSSNLDENPAHTYTPPSASRHTDPPFADMRRIESHILAFFRSADAQTLSSFEGVSDPSIFINAAKKARSYDEFFSLCANKLYTSSRIRRTVINCICGVEKKYFKTNPLYTSLLAANKKGRAYLRSISKSANIPIITKPARFSILNPEAKKQFAVSARAFEIYSLCMPFERKNESELKNTPYILY